MAQIVVDLFDTHAQAEQAITDLLRIGVAREQISMITRDMPEARALEVGGAPDNATKLASGVAGGLVGGGIIGAAWPGLSEDEGRFYVEAIRHGGTLVTVQPDSSDPTPMIAVLRRNGAVEPAYRRAEWDHADQATSPGHEDSAER